MTGKRFMTAQEAAQILGVRVETIYAYVSRGLLRSEPAGPPQARQHRYLTSDVKRLQQRQALRSDPARTTLDALHFGTPVLESSLTLIEEDQLYFRGKSALELAAMTTFEQVVGLLWRSEQSAPATGPDALAYNGLAEMVEGIGLAFLLTFQTVLPAAMVRDKGAYDLRPAGVVRSGWHILRLFTRLVAGRSADQERPIAEQLATGWGHTRPEAVAIINAALILSADHELNASSFTARCVASTRANPYAVVQAGLSALQGPRHGGHTERVAAQFAEIGVPAQAEPVLAARLRRGDALVGFGHQLYPGGDPRAGYLLEQVRASFPESPIVPLAAATCAAAWALVQERPTLDVGLVVVEKGLGLPRGAALALFAIGRTAGWIGHALEAYAADQLIRPRARYVGILPNG